MNMHWRKAEGKIPQFQDVKEVLAVSKNGGYLLGFLREGDDGSWLCASPITGSYFNEYLEHVTWYLVMAEVLATVPKN